MRRRGFVARLLRFLASANLVMCAGRGQIALTDTRLTAYHWGTRRLLFALAYGPALSDVSHQWHGPTRVRVLIVDDYPDAAASMGALLEVLGYDARWSIHPQQALELVRGWTPQVALIEMRM